MRFTTNRAAIAATCALAAAFTGAALAGAVPAAATPSTTAVISEVYGGGGNSGATLRNDFIELYDLGSSPVSLANFSVQYISGAPTATSTWSVTPLQNSIPAGGHYLVQEAPGTGGSQDLPTPDAQGSIALSGTSGTVALVAASTALTCTTATACAADPDIVDLVGYGTAAIHEGSADASGASNTLSVQRDAAGTDTDQNGADLTAGTPTPTNTGTGGGGGGGGTATSIHDIQGDSFVSPDDGDNVTGVTGIVTALRTTSSDGFWMQDPTPDNDPATSEGIFVYTGSKPTVAVGDAVSVDGTVSDYYALGSGETLSSTSSLSVTEITRPVVTTQSTGNALPAPIVITADTVPDAYAPDLGSGNIEDTPITPSRSALDYYESVEGMRVEVDDVRVVGPSNQYGEQYVTTKPTQDATPRGGTELLAENATPSGRLEVATLDGSALGLNVGDELQGATVGPIDWSLFGGYVLEASTIGTVVHNPLPPVVATAGSRKQLSVATYNVENLAPQDPDSKFQALGEGVVQNLASPDIVALEEIQDNSGSTDDGTVAADQTIAKLVAAISAAGGPHYDYREIDPVNDKDGGQPGGNIRNVFLFNPARTTFLGDDGTSTANRSTTGTVAQKVDGQARLSLSPGRIDPTNPVWTSSRKPLVGQFMFRRRIVTVIGNHFDAKLGDQNADGRFQYPTQSSQTQRAGQASVVHHFVEQLLAINARSAVVVLGDLNDYQFSTPLAVLRTGTADDTGTPILTDLITGLPLDEQYTYVYDGVSQVLDHILVSPAVHDIDYQVVHVNSEYSNQVSDHDPQVVDLRP